MKEDAVFVSPARELTIRSRFERVRVVLATCFARSFDSDIPSVGRTEIDRSKLCYFCLAVTGSRAYDTLLVINLCILRSFNCKKFTY